MAQTVETWVRSLGQEDPLEKRMATHSNTLAWRIPWTEEPGGLQSMGSQSDMTEQLIQHQFITFYTFWCTSYFYFYIHCSVPTTKNLVSICHHSIDPLYINHVVLPHSFPFPSQEDPWDPSIVFRTCCWLHEYKASLQIQWGMSASPVLLSVPLSGNAVFRRRRRQERTMFNVKGCWWWNFSEWSILIVRSRRWLWLMNQRVI